MPFHNLKFTRAFSLVELLIVIAILGILASFTSVTMIGHQKQARDAQRKSDLQQIKKALQSAKNDCKGAAYYPHPGFDYIYDGWRAYDLLISELVLDKYLSSSINDPKSSLPVAEEQLPYLYEYFGDWASLTGEGTWIALSATTYCPWMTDSDTKSVTQAFFLRAKLENDKDPDIAKSFNSCPMLLVTIGLIGNPGSFFLPNQPTLGDGYYYVCNE